MKRDGRDIASPEARPSYSPQLRTALVLTGTGAAGAYHAGVLRALEEAGIKIDLLAGRGVGVAAALLGAVGSGHRLWEANGLWQRPAVARLYRWRTALRVAAAAALLALAALAVPFVVALAAVLVYALSFIVTLVSVDSGTALVATSGNLLDSAFGPRGLPTILPRLVTLGVVVLLVAAAAAGLTVRAQQTARPERSGWWWDLLGAPWTSEPAVRTFRHGVWQAIHGAAALKEPVPSDLGRRYSELLVESLGQPGFREVLAVVHDLDARRDLVFALLAEPHRSRFFPRVGQEADRRGETFDLAGVAREHVIDALTAALSVPVLTDPHLIRLSPEGYWRGETHRLCDRPGATGRLLEEVSAAGVTQVIVVAPFSELRAPHGLSSRRGHIAARAGDYLAAADVAALDDSVRALSGRFDTLFVIRPVHSAIGPFDFTGAFDERSDRRQALPELIDRGYQDAYRQFIEPVVGASGERLAAPARGR
jgi:hypothetical protein